LRSTPERSACWSVHPAAARARCCGFSPASTTTSRAHRNHFPGELSLGLARRVALARAFAVEPELLILDEPLASLDAALAARLRDQIAILVGGRSMITLLVTHDADDAVRLGDRLILLSPRPARVLGELPIRTPRSARGDAEIAAIKSEVTRRINGDQIREDAS
jgi:ABC-type nitrate/sulfonate/bicarbonate transport system ATPase subunit